ncbi:MAG: hypothetical protein K0R54_2236 [Clostridiaceae bacterium]|jgi:hypothetical protein|nr:hypothetical protein [Clostridiaceae bacterium]
MALLDDFKEKLKITWNDENTGLEDSISSGKTYIQSITGTTLDFEVTGEPRTLLIEYCRYDYNNAIEYFEENFGSRLSRLAYMEEIKEYQAAQTEVI